MNEMNAVETVTETTLGPRLTESVARAESAPCPLYVLATPSGRGAALAAEIWQALHDSGRVTVGGPVASGLPMPMPSPGARHLVFVDSPAAAIAGAMQSAKTEPIDLSGVLAAWTATARQLLRLVIQQPTRCLCVDVAEALNQPEALWTAIADWETALERAPAPALHRADECALTLLLAEAATQKATGALRLYDELQATSAVLGNDVVPAGPVLPAAALNAFAAMHRQQAQTADALRQAQTERDAQRQVAERLRTQLQRAAEEALDAARQVTDAVRRDRDLARQSLTDVERERDAVRMTLAGFEQERDAHRQKSDLLLAQLHQVQEELEAVFLKGKDYEKQLAEDASVRTQLAELEQRHSALQAERDAQAQLAADRALVVQEAQRSAAAALNEARRAADAVRQERDAARQALAGAEQERDAQRQESDLLLAQLHQVQEELETLFLKGPDHEGQEVALLAGQMQRMHGELQRQHSRQRREGRPAAVTAAQVELGAQRMDPPHRGLVCLLRELRIDEHEIPLLELRLVEHHGHPGLVLLDGPAPGAGLGAFVRSGDEDGRAFMLLVPEGQPTRTVLARMGTRDWRLIGGVLDVLDEALASSAAEPLLFWRGVLRRLRSQIDDQPVRLRYDALDLAAETEQTLRLDYRRALFGARLHDNLAVRWKPGAGGGSAGQPPTLLLGELTDAGPPLAAWPMDAQGRPLAEWTLPLDHAMPASERGLRWRALPPRDRELLLALLDALPAGAERLSEAKMLPPGHDRASLAAAAAHWLPEARRALDPAFLLRRAARKLRGILRPAA